MSSSKFPEFGNPLGIVICEEPPAHRVSYLHFFFLNFIFVEHSTSGHWVQGSKPGVFKSGGRSFYISLPGDRSVVRKSLSVKKRR